MLCYGKTNRSTQSLMKLVSYFTDKKDKVKIDFYQGCIYYQNKQYEKAISHFESVIV